MKTSFNFNNIILIGFMGSGKTEVGKRLAQKLQWNFIDTDDIIEKVAGTTIAKIFETKGEKYFRNIESKAIETLQGCHNFIIATGGGIILKKQNIKKLKQIGLLVLLAVKPDTVIKRLTGVSNRPLINFPDPENKIKELLKIRKPLYQATADSAIDTTNLNIDQVTHEILKELAKHE